MASRTLTRAPSRSATAPACSVCGLGPARELVVRRQVGFIVWSSFDKQKAFFCRDHGIISAKKNLRRSLLLGWWSVVGLATNWIAVFGDWRALRRARRLPFPVADPSRVRGPLLDAATALTQEPPEVRKARRSVLRTVGAGMAMGVAAAVVAIVTGSDLTAPLDRRLVVQHGMTVVLYAVIGVLVTRLLDRKTIRPRLVEGSYLRAITIGTVVGIATAALVVAFNSLLVGRLMSDPTIVTIFYESSWFHVLVLVMLVSVAAPFFEEVLFRGLLVESLRSRGRNSAVLGAAVAFAFWHLNPASITYYLLVGFLLGYLYWKLGLAGSISAHAAFNTALIFAAVISLSSGSLAVDHDGVSADLPAGWVHTSSPNDDEEVDLVASSVTGAEIVVEHAEGRRVFSIPGARRSVTVAGINGSRMSVTEDGVEKEIVLLARRDRSWIVTFTPAGSTRAKREFDQILTTLKLA